MLNQAVLSFRLCELGTFVHLLLRLSTHDDPRLMLRELGQFLFDQRLRILRGLILSRQAIPTRLSVDRIDGLLSNQSHHFASAFE